jgi:phage terminase large subunit-like protein
MRIVKRKELNHGGNPVSRWNMDSLEVKMDPQENIRPVKPDRDKTAARIDGIVALIMAEAAQMRYESEDSEVTVSLDII